MTWGIGIGFSVEPTEKDIKKIKREVAHDRTLTSAEAKAKAFFLWS